MALQPGTYTLGPDRGTLTVRTGKTGAAAKAGHNLLIEMGAWEATIRIGEGLEDAEVTLKVDTGSVHVLEGTGGMAGFGEDDKTNTAQTIHDDVLKRTPVEFHSTEAWRNPDGTAMSVRGELTLMGQRRPITFELAIDDEDRLTGDTTIAQTTWGMKPYSTLFGTLKVADEVQVAIDARLG
jgi:polyisoprenoid-binding protein YceI